MNFWLIQIKSLSSEIDLIWNIQDIDEFGGAEEDRTPDPLRARQVLSQLSYDPILPASTKTNCVDTLKYL